MRRGHGRQPRLGSSLRKAFEQLEGEAKTQSIHERLLASGIEPGEFMAWTKAVRESPLTEEAITSSMEAISSALDAPDAPDAVKALAARFYALTEDTLDQEDLVAILQFARMSAMTGFTNGFAVGVQFTINKVEGDLARRQNRPGR